MDNIYILIVGTLIVLAIIDLVVGVSNDAVNFLNSAVGSKAASLRTILLVASLGVAVGAVFSSGMMEVARKGIFMPGHFHFDEIMVIFTAVMITDILLLDIFNTLGMPTSTTVSIVFELLGAAVSVALIKILTTGQEISELGSYINTGKAIAIISGIFFSIVVAFTIGTIVQYISRLIFTFHYEKKMKYVGSLFAGFALTAITYFILIKGLGGTGINHAVLDWIREHSILIIVMNFIFWTLLSQVLFYLKYNILKFIVLVGTFGLAMAFAGNDLVNFIGVPIAGLQSYGLWHASGVAANEYSMTALAGKVETPRLLLLAAGFIMVITLWFSKKAKTVLATGVDLSRQGDGIEKFQPNTASRLVVRASVLLGEGVKYFLPNSLKNKIDKSFAKPVIKLPRNKRYEVPAFDLVRASVNLMVASILISIGTSYKLPLSTTYVTFMVAMGASLADRAWDRESAVYRVAGVLNVVGGWFVTALIAFVTAGIFAYLIHLGGVPMIGILLLLVLLMLARNYITFTKKRKEKISQKGFRSAEITTIKEVIEDSSNHIKDVVSRVSKLYGNVIDELANYDLKKLKKTKNKINKLDKEIDSLRNEVYYFIQSLDESSVEASRFYILVLGYLQDISQSVNYIIKASYSHVNNNHKSLKKSQIKDLEEIKLQLDTMLIKISAIFENRSFDELKVVINEKYVILDHVSKSIEKQIKRVRTEETSPKNATLYFSLLLESKDIIKTTVSLMELYEEFYLSTKNSDK